MIAHDCIRGDVDGEYAGKLANPFFNPATPMLKVLSADGVMTA